MSRDDPGQTGRHPPHGQIGYLQLPALDVARSAAFYETVFGWSVDLAHASFEAPGMIGQWTTERVPAAGAGPVVWICADQLRPTLQRAVAGGGTVQGRPRLDGGERWLVELDDPAGNRIGVVVPVRAAQSQTMIAVRDVEASSRWYQHLLGLQSDHGGPHYERLLSAGVLVLQLHDRETEHHHGRIGGDGESATASCCGSARSPASTTWSPARRELGASHRSAAAPEPARGPGQRPGPPRALGRGPRRLHRRGRQPRR